MDKQNTLGGFEAVLDSFIPKTDGEQTIEDLENQLNNEDEEELEPGEDKIEDPVIAKMKKDKVIETKDEPEEEEEDIEPTEPIEKPKKEDKHETKEDNENDTDFEESGVVSSFFGAIADKLGWDVNDEEEVPQDVESLIGYFKNKIEE